MNIKKLLFLFSFLILFDYSIQPVKAQVLFSDDFNDGNANGWIVPRNTCSEGWTVSSNQYGITTNRCITETIPTALTIGLNSNYSFEVDMSMPLSLNDRNFVFKYKDNNNWYGIHTYGNSAYVQKVVNGTEYFLNNRQFNYNFIVGNTYHFKIDVMNNTTYLVYIDGILQATVPDTLPFFDNFSAGLQASGNSQVWFDNVVVTEIVAETPTPTPTPTPTIAPTPTSTPTPTATPTVAPTPQPTFGPFELPFNYTGRLNSTNAQFKNAFWDKMRAVFDHTFKTGIFRPFTGNIYASCSDPISCYDSHNGVDFSKPSSDGFAYSVGTGKVIYRSLYPDCVTQGGYGCSVIIRYQGNLYGLYAHLNTITVNESQNVTSNTQIGEIGQTGAATGEHLHFGVLKPINDKLTSSAIQFMRNKDWKNLLDQISANIKPPKYNSYCTYKAPNGISFAFQDPLGWFGSDKDPWSLPKSKSGCGITSPYLWKYNVL